MNEIAIALFIMICWHLYVFMYMSIPGRWWNSRGVASQHLSGFLLFVSSNIIQDNIALLGYFRIFWETWDALLNVMMLTIVFQEPVYLRIVLNRDIYHLLYACTQFTHARTNTHMHTHLHVHVYLCILLFYSTVLPIFWCQGQAGWSWCTLRLMEEKHNTMNSSTLKAPALPWECTTQIKLVNTIASYVHVQESQ